MNTDDPPPCPRQESNLDLPLRRTKAGSAGWPESLGTVTVRPPFGGVMPGDATRLGWV